MTVARLAAVLLGALVSADALGAAALPAPLREVRPELQPVGAATLRWFGLHVYDTALYAPEGAYTTNGTAALSIRYAISIKHKRLLETTLKEWRRMGKGTESQRARWVQLLEPLWPDLKPGDSLTAFIRRDGATAFYFGDRLLGEIPDPAFGPVFFAIWLGDNCRYPDVRDGLLGLKAADRKGR